MKIGIMGGTFNPIHNGHLLIGEYARTELQLSKVLYIPTGEPGHKSRVSVASSSDRYEMVTLAIEDNPYFEGSDMEVCRRGITYTLDTIKELIKEYDDLAEFYFIIGEDSLFTLETWKKFKELSRLCRFVVFKRKPRQDGEILEKIAYLNSEYVMDIIYLKSPLMEISSTDIRDRVRLGKSIKYQVPKVIEQYIHLNDLYGAD